MQSTRNTIIQHALDRQLRGDRRKYEIADPAIQLLARIGHGADVSIDLYGAPEAPGLKAIAEGFRDLGLKDDHEVLKKEFIVYDAVYEYCRRRLLSIG